MSLTDKVIKNTVYYLISQVIGFIFPLITTPFIISKICNVQFGLYALLFGFLGTFGLFDFSISTSFIKFISEHYNKKDYESLNYTINTGLIFYVVFSIIIFAAGWIFTEKILSIINVPNDLIELSKYAFRISLIIFLITSSTTIFSSILISIQKMYITSFIGLIINSLNFISILVLLSLGYGLSGLLWSQLVTVFLSTVITVYFSKKYMPEMSFSFSNFRGKTFKDMSKFGIQMQISKLSSFASNKYDEFLLAFFSILSSVTYYNIAFRIARVGQFLPFQLIPQVAPVAAELKAKENISIKESDNTQNKPDNKLIQLFNDITKYLILFSLPVFLYLFAFSDIIITTWMGNGYELSAFILKIIVLGQLINMIFSAPGNSITPNIGIPKYQMYEGLINLSINLVLSYFLIKYYKIIGAAYGNTIATAIASFYVFYISVKYFKQNHFRTIFKIYLKPLTISVVSILITYLIYFLVTKFICYPQNRFQGIIFILISGFIFIGMFTFGIFNACYLNERDYIVIIKAFFKVVPLQSVINKNISKQKLKTEFNKYSNELVSICILTYNRLDLFKKCINSLLKTLKDINYELIIFDNNSDDGTKEFLKDLQNNISPEDKPDKLKIIYNKKNIGTAGKGKIVEMAKGDFIIGLDDDVTYFPDNWVQDMIYAYKNIPFMGYLVADVIQDDKTTGAKQPDDFYFSEYYNNGKIKLSVCPTGGWCFMISGKVYNEVGKFYFPKGRIFFPEDADYGNRVLNKGLKVGILDGLKVYHATGEYYNRNYKIILDSKLLDYKKHKPFFYEFKLSLNKIFSSKRYYRRFLDFVIKNDLI